MAETIRRPVAADALAAAREAFMDGRRIDMGAIAAELGIGRTTLHRWYGTREDLIDGVLCELSSEYFAEARSAARGRGEALVVSVVRSLVTQAVAVRVQGTVSATLPVAVVVSEPGVFSMNMQMIPGTVVGAYRRHEWIGSEVPVRRAGSYPGPVIEESTVDANGTVAFSTLPPGSYIAWAADYPLRRRFFVVTE